MYTYQGLEVSFTQITSLYFCMCFCTFALVENNSSACAFVLVLVENNFGFLGNFVRVSWQLRSY